MDRMIAVVCGRRTKWIVLVAWLLLTMMVAAPAAGKLTGVQENDPAQWLPGDAEATQVVELQERFQTSDSTPAVVVYARTAGLTPADEAKAAADASAIGALAGVAGPLDAPVRAQDGQALLLAVPVRNTDDVAEFTDTMEAIRDVVGSGGGLAVHIAGPSGFAFDNIEAAQGVNSTLLMFTVLVVIVILLFAYRSPVLWLLPVMCAGMALLSAQAVIYLLAEYAGLTVNAQSAAILTVLVFGASTNYALLLVARYREELGEHADRHHAMAIALRRAGPAVIASAATVSIGLLCFSVAAMNNTSGLGPVLAIGIAVGLLVMITLMPALLVIFGRWIFWPVKPKVGSGSTAINTRLWARLGERIARRPRPVWIGTAVALGVLAIGLTQLHATGLAGEDAFVDKPDSVVGQEVLGQHFPAGQNGQPVVVIGAAGAADQLASALRGTSGIAEVSEPVVRGDLVKIEGTLASPPDSDAAKETVEAVRDTVHAIDGADAKVGGGTALTIDTNAANSRDNRLIIPIVLIVVLLILALLLRAVVAPLLLVATVVLSFAAALGASAFLFENVFGFAGTDSGFPLFIFVFLVALGIDYNIFLMTRVREESKRHGTHRGMLIGLTATGGVITSAGLVLAGTFAIFSTVPVVSFVELGIAVALGVLIDTFIVRSILVPALGLDLGSRIWAPSRMAEPSQPAEETRVEELEPA